MSHSPTLPSRLSKGKSMLFKILLVYGAWCFFLYLLQDKIIFPYEQISSAKVSTPHEDIRTKVWIQIGEGKSVEGWFFSGQNSDSAKPRPCVVFFHGNGELIDFASFDISTYLKWGFSVFLPEYRGYGRSGGKPSEKGIVQDMQEFHAWLVQRPEVDPQKIIYHGRSLGGCVASQLSKTHPPAAMILQSTFTSVVSMTSSYWVPSFLCRHPFRNDRVIRTLTIPIFVTHGSNDKIAPVKHGRKLQEIASNSVYYEVSAGHNDFPFDQAFWEKIQAFLQEKVGLTIN